MGEKAFGKLRRVQMPLSLTENNSAPILIYRDWIQIDKGCSFTLKFLTKSFENMV